MPLSRFLEILRNIAIPVILGIIFLCMLVGLIAFALTPEGLNPVEAIVLRVYLLQNENELNTPAGLDPQRRRFEVMPNDTGQTIGVNLVTEGFINNGTLFARYVQYEGLDDQLRNGVFFLSETMTIPQIAANLTDARPSTVRLTVIEGWRAEQIAALIDQQPLLDFSGADFLADVGASSEIPEAFQARHGIPDDASLEGFLFPATYDIPVEGTVRDFRQQMLNAFDANVTQQMILDAANAGWTTYEIVTIASIVEREAVIPDERPQIASVYINRLSDQDGETGGFLQADPTTQYGLGTAQNWWPVLTVEDYQNNHPYNTYQVIGLPPGPIANPGVSSIRAAIYPADTTFKFFRAACDGSGRHQFTIGFDEHLANACP